MGRVKTQVLYARKINTKS